MTPNLSAFQVPPKDYSQEHMTRLVRQLQILVNQLSTPGPISGASDLTNSIKGYPVSALTLTDIPTVATGLPSGSVWSDGGTLKIVS